MRLREANLNDLDVLLALADTLNTVNLQPDRDILTEQINLSHQSFRHQVNIEEAQYLFVLEYRDQVIGTALIIAQHGTYDRPAVYFRVRQDQKYSTSLKAHFKHQVLDLAFDYDGPTEIGGLIIDPEARHLTSMSLGKPLSFVRFLYMAMYRECFRDEIVAELLPELRPDGKSDLWEALGQKFCGIDYTEADRRSRHDIEFIRALFPMFPIYTTLLPKEVQLQIGHVGSKSQPAKSLLTRLGFKWDNSIDPFDGGPTYRVSADQCLAIRRTVSADFIGELSPQRLQSSPDGQDYRALVAKIQSPDLPFIATLASYERTFHGIRLSSRATAILELEPGDRIAFMPFSGTNLISF